MKVKLLFFAGLREQLGIAGEAAELPAGVATLRDLRAHLAARGPQWQAAFGDGRLLRAAVNQSMASPETAIAPDDEIAFFPPVTGG